MKASRANELRGIIALALLFGAMPVRAQSPTAAGRALPQVTTPAPQTSTAIGANVAAVRIVTQDGKVLANGSLTSHGSPPREDAVAHVRGYFERNATARMAMAYYYQEFILGLAAPQAVPMMDVVIALDLSGEGAVSDYKKLLQGFIWQERGHSRDLAEFLLSNGLLTQADLDLARKVAIDHERSGQSEMAKQRLQYRPKK